MTKQEIQEQIRSLANKLNDYSDGLYNYYYNTWIDYDDIFSLIDDYSSYLVEVKAYSELIDWFEDCPEAVFYIKMCFERELITSSYDAYMLIGTALTLYYSDKLKEDYTTLKELHRLHQELAELEQKEDEKEFLLKLKSLSEKIVHWEDKLFHTGTDVADVNNYLQFELEEQIVEVFGDTRGIKLNIDGNEIMGDVGYDWDEEDADDPEKQEDFYYESLETNRKLLKELSENIKKFIEIIEKELKE